jgi:hypothetical protein
MKLWKQTHDHLTQQQQQEQQEDSRRLLVCMGGDWFTFPSHFFLPTNVAQLAYVEDNFHGLLPQHFISPYGSSIASVLPVNDQNKEEKSRYTPLESCDYLVMTTPPCLFSSDSQEILTEECRTSLSPLQKRLVEQKDHVFIPQICEEINDPVRSASSLGRAYAIPFLSEDTNRFMRYCLYSRELSSSSSSS